MKKQKNQKIYFLKSQNDVGQNNEFNLINKKSSLY